MKILVTGSSGHLGEAFLRTINRKQYDARGLDIKPGPYTTHVGSITNSKLVNNCMAGIDCVIHTATLHKPHIATHSKADFVDVNVMGTLNLLEAAKQHQVKAFIYTSTTSTFGDAMAPSLSKPAVWITEETVPIPKNIYGVTKTAAEDLCQMYFRNHGLPCLILKTSRFFMEEDDQKAIRLSFDDLNAKANEFTHRRVDVEDVVSAHFLAMEKATSIGFGKYIISATSSFQKSDLAELNNDANAVVQRIYPEFAAVYQQRGWKMFPRIGRVYRNEKARRELGWQPKYDFAHVLNCLRGDQPFWSPLALKIGAKGYHDTEFEEGPYPVKNDN